MYLPNLPCIRKDHFHIIPVPFDEQQQKKKTTLLIPLSSPTSPDPLHNPSRPRLRQRRNPPPRKSHTRILPRHFLDSAKFRNQHHSSNSTLSSHETTARSSGKSEICRKYLTYTIGMPHLQKIHRFNLIQQTGDNIHYRIKRLRTNGWSGSDSCL